MAFPTTKYYNLFLSVIIEVIMYTAAQKIKAFREKRNYSQEFMANQLGISQPAYAKIEQGKTNMNLDRLKRISEILQVDWHYFMEGNTIIQNVEKDRESHWTEIVNDNIQKVYKKLIKPLEEENTRLREKIEQLENILKKRNNNDLID